MKLDKKAALLLACTFACTSTFVACGGDDTEPSGDGDGQQGGDGDSDSGGGAPSRGDGDANTSSGDGDSEGDGGNGDSGDSGDGMSSPPSGPQCDEPGGAQCTGTASGLVCPEGSTDAVDFTCAVGDVCRDGACVGQCEPGETECVGGSVQRVCTADGRSWVNIPCQNGDVCEDGACGMEGGLVCVPGEKDCAGNTTRTCKDDGSGWDEEDCPGATECRDGLCAGSVCTVGATKCDDSTHFSGTMFEGAEPNYSVILRCVDGERWVTEACPSDDDTYSICVYDGVDRAEAARYRDEVNEWVFTNLIANDTNFGLFPEAPKLPENTSARCVEAPQDRECDWRTAFFETPAMTRDCTDLDDPEEGNAVWKGYTECRGLPPYAPLELTETECSGSTVCSLESRGCVPSECVPEDETCGDGESAPESSFGVCFYEGTEAHWVYSSCPAVDEEPGVCTTQGTAPARTALCNGEPANVP